MTHSALGPFPSQTSVDQLVWLIRAAANEVITAADFVKAFRDVHEAIESTSRIRYASKEQARLIWDVLWDLEYYSPDPAHEENPEEWHTLEVVMKTVKRVGPKLAEL
jgi:hypothetical protein